jgi:hypothetical protein
LTTPIEKEKEALKRKLPKIDIIEPLSPSTHTEFKNNSNTDFNNKDICFFIPSSGLGSRMYKFLFEFVESGEESIEIRTFFQNFEKFPFASDLLLKEPSLLQMDRVDAAYAILNEFPFISPKNPKGLMPIHQYGDEVFCAFKEYENYIDKNFPGASIHFTINENFEKEIRFVLSPDKLDKDINFSFQEESTNSFVFDSEYKLVYNQNIPTKRPSGHGALINNLNEIEEKYIFLKNIDNIQRRDNKSASNAHYAMLNELINLEKQRNIFQESLESGKPIEEQVQKWLIDQELIHESCSVLRRDQILSIIDAPIRVCSMVKNTGQPGGGPYWVKNENGFIQPQILEAIQIKEHPDSLSLLESSTHFNPVNICCSTYNKQGTKYDLADFCNEKEYFVVQKDHMGKKVQYIEKPGLWNGAMGKWLSKFIEVEETTFTPIKSILNLLDPSHQPSNNA